MTTYSHQNRMKLVLPWIVLAIPAATFIGLIARFGVDVPIWDDITQIIWITNTIIDPSFESPWVLPQDKPDILHALFYPNAGHIPLLTRLFALLQYSLGGINFHIATIVACVIWLCASCLLAKEVHRHGFTPWMVLPLSFLLFSPSQWEAMTMMLGGWQLYVGTLFFPILTLLAISYQRLTLVPLTFFCALMTSGGALALLPIGMAYFVLRRNWLKLSQYAMATLPSLAVFLYFNPVSHNINGSTTPDIAPLLKFVLLFMGNLVTLGSYDLHPLETLHFYLGLFILIIGTLMLLLCKEQHFFKMLFIYVVLLAAMTGLKRMDTYIVPRYSVFALLGVAVVYVLLVSWLRQRQVSRKYIHWIAGAACVISAGLWVNNTRMALIPLTADEASRIQALQAFAERGDTSGLMWHAGWCTDILHQARNLRVYDYTKPRQ